RASSSPATSRACSTTCWATAWRWRAWASSTPLATPNEGARRGEWEWWQGAGGGPIGPPPAPCHHSHSPLSLHFLDARLSAGGEGMEGRRRKELVPPVDREVACAGAPTGDTLVRFVGHFHVGPGVPVLHRPEDNDLGIVEHRRAVGADQLQSDTLGDR